MNFIPDVTDDLTSIIINCALKVHSLLGSGLLESVYKECLAYELTKKQLLFTREEAIPIIYEEVKLEKGFRADLIVDKKVIVEAKTVEVLNDIHLAQTLTHLKFTKLRVGLLINFNVVHLKTGIRRVFYNHGVRSKNGVTEK